MFPCFIDLGNNSINGLGILDRKRFLLEFHTLCVANLKTKILRNESVNGIADLTLV